MRVRSKYPEDSPVIQVDISAAEIVVEPGTTAQLSVTITNQQENDDHLFIEIEGIDIEWYAIPVPSFTIAAGQQQTARVMIKIARACESYAGTYPFVVRVRSMESGEFGIQQAVLSIKPFSSLMMDINPKRAISTFIHHANVYDISVSNLGNHEETLDLYASDPDDDCAYEFDRDRITLKSGHIETIPLLIEPVARPFVGSGRLIGFTVTARSSQDSYVSASVHGQLERRPFLSTLTALMLSIIVIGVLGWALFHPHPAEISSFTADNMKPVAGSTILLSWAGMNFGPDAYITPGNIPVKSSVGSVQVTAPQPGLTIYTLHIPSGGRDITRDLPINIQPAPIPPKARIRSFTASQTRIHPGDSVTLSWDVINAISIILNPLNQSGDPRQYLSQEVKPDSTTTYILTAKDGAGNVITRQLTVTVVPPNESLATITYFKAKPDSIYTNQKTTLSWSVDNAMSVDIDNNIGSNLPVKGQISLTPAQTTTYTLSAIDNRGIIRTQTVTVTVSEPPPPPTTTIPPSTGDTGTPIQ